MLAAPACRRHIACRVWTSAIRSYAQGRRGRHGGGEKRSHGSRDTADTKSAGVETNPRDDTSNAVKAARPSLTRPSLIELLFPERYGVAGTHREEAREVPKIHPQPVMHSNRESPLTPSRDADHLSARQMELSRVMEAQPPSVAVLVLRNAGKNLTEEDFRRVIPRGKHLEGWTLEQGDILRIIPGRDLKTLEPTGSYYLLFSSPLSAFTYQGHVTRIYRMVAANAPSSLLSPIPPPSGQIIEGVEAHEAINSFTLIPPDQNLQLRQLKNPLAPALESLVKHGGYKSLVDREDRMPFEARLTLEGPQLSLQAIRHILRISSRDRGLAWSGSEHLLPRLSQWTPILPELMPSPSDKKASAFARASQRERETQQPRSSSVLDEAEEEEAFGLKHASNDGEARRTPRPVYIAGFSTEQAFQSFMHFWHGKPMTWERTGNASGDLEGDLAPITHVQPLW